MLNNHNSTSLLNQEKDENNFQIEDGSSLHKYRTETPNIVYDLDLDPYEGWLYSHLKRIAGDQGACFASNKTLAIKSKISERKVKDCKNSLSQKGLIKITERKKANGSPDTTLIQIIDLWPQNFVHFQKKFSRACGARGVGHVVPEGRACGARKEEPIEEEHYYKKHMSEVETSLASDDAHFCANYLYEKLKERRPSRKPPNLKHWIRDFDSIIRIDEISKDKILEAIDFVMKSGSPFNVQSPVSLRTKYENIADHIALAKKRSEKDSRVPEAIEVINRYLLGITAGNLCNELSFKIGDNGSIYHTIEKKFYPRSYEKFMEALQEKKIPQTLLDKINRKINNIN